jgi:SAM-dependent MidA family methyltransferase
VTLLEQILAEIRARGTITFARYVDLCLYHSELGYYRAPRQRFGAAGDFYTSAQVHAAFARLLVRRWAGMWQALGGGPFTLLEMGAGRGEVAREAQAWAARAYPEFARSLRYIPLEYGDPLPAPFSGCVFSNEFFDAQPAHVVRFQSGELYEMHVAERGGRLAWAQGRLSSPELAGWLDRLHIQPEDGQTIELSLEAAAWMRRLGALLERGWVITFDYGYRAREISGGRRFFDGSLMSYRKHTASQEVLRDPGQRDLTAHVNFDLLAEAGREAGLVESRFCSQSRYLMDLGQADQFSEVFADCQTEADRVRARLLLKTLLFDLGETIQVLEQSSDE